jgi:septal ring factor EnvC (AmiA/AmiB activator)
MNDEKTPHGEPSKHTAALPEKTAHAPAQPQKAAHPASHIENRRRAGAFALLATFVGCIVFGLLLIVVGVKLSHRNAQLADVQKQLDQAKKDGESAQSDLEKAKQSAADLQTQLTKAKGQVTDMQSQLDLANSKTTDLQNQVDRAKAQTAEVQGQLDKSKAQSADLQNQLAQTAAGSQQLLTQLDQAKIQAMDQDSKLQKAQADIAALQPMLLKVRHMPVTTSLEAAHWGKGATLRINNLDQQPLNVSVTVSGQGSPRSQSNVIGAGATLNVDKLAAGDNVVVASEGYDPISLTVH